MRIIFVFLDTRGVLDYKYLKKIVSILATVSELFIIYEKINSQTLTDPKYFFSAKKVLLPKISHQI